MAHESVGLLVQGMTCHDCAETVEQGLAAQPGVVEAHVLWLTGTANVVYDPDITTIDEILEAPVFSSPQGRHHFRAKLVPGCC